MAEKVNTGRKYKMRNQVFKSGNEPLPTISTYAR